MRLEPLLEAQDVALVRLLKEANGLVLLVKKWQKASAAGDFSALDKTGPEALRSAEALTARVRETEKGWRPEGDYLSDGHWLDEIEELARIAADVRVLRDGESLVAPPSVVRAQGGYLKLNGETRKGIRPSLLLQELRKIAVRQPAGGKDFLQSLYAAWQGRPDKANSTLRFRDAYDLFALAPGWRAENSENAFAQRLYALHASDVYATRDGTPYSLQEPSGKVGPKDVFRVRGRDGREISYYGIGFNPEARR